MKSMFLDSNFDPYKKGWHEINSKKDLPHVGEIVLWEMKSGFRFYGHMTVFKTVVSELYPTKVYDYWLFKRWIDDGTHVGENQWAK